MITGLFGQQAEAMEKETAQFAQSQVIDRAKSVAMAPLQIAKWAGGKVVGHYKEEARSAVASGIYNKLPWAGGGKGGGGGGGGGDKGINSNKPSI